ncbi:BLUF domain-containing protein [Brevundimonas sp.]
MIKLERLLYASTATGRTDNLMNVATILAESDRNNARDGLTGALAAHEGQYLQVVEGQPAVLDGLLRRLESDPRHKDIRLIDRLPIAQRRFEAWTMANARITPPMAGLLERLVHDPQLDPKAAVDMLFEASQAA